MNLIKHFINGKGVLGSSERTGNILLYPVDFNHGMYIIRIKFESQFNLIKILR